MSEKAYKQICCRETGMDCDFMVRAGTEDEAMRLASEHACEIHKICVITPEVRHKMAHAIRNIWCAGGQCGYMPKEGEIPYWG